MAWIPPGNRSNQHIASWHTLLSFPALGNTSYEVARTKRANEILAEIAPVYQTGDTVTGTKPVTRFSSTTITGTIHIVSNNLGQIEYHVQADDGSRHWLLENDITVVQEVAA